MVFPGSERSHPRGIVLVGLADWANTNFVIVLRFYLILGQSVLFIPFGILRYAERMADQRRDVRTGPVSGNIVEK